MDCFPREQWDWGPIIHHLDFGHLKHGYLSTPEDPGTSSQHIYKNPLFFFLGLTADPPSLPKVSACPARTPLADWLLSDQQGAYIFKVSVGQDHWLWPAFPQLILSNPFQPRSNCWTSRVSLVYPNHISLLFSVQSLADLSWIELDFKTCTYAPQFKL
jgi:hypothetical protein